MANIEVGTPDSLVLPIPAELLEQVETFTHDPVNLALQNGNLVVTKRLPRKTLAQMLAECDPDAPVSQEDQDWINRRPVGRELL